MGIFKRKTAPNGGLISNLNTTFVCSVTGSDSNPGTMEQPVKSLAVANGLRNNLICINDGVYSGDSDLNNWAPAPKTYFPNQNFFVLDGNLLSNNRYTLHNCIIRGNELLSNNYKGSMSHCIIEGRIQGELSGIEMINTTREYVLINEFRTTSFSGSKISGISEDKNLTIKKFYNYINQHKSAFDHIFVELMDLYRFKNQDTTQFPRFENCLFRKALQWQWNGNVIEVNYSADKSRWIEDLKQSLKNYALESLTDLDQEYLITLANNAFLPGCVIHDDINETPIFNKYHQGVPVDFTLYLHKENPALYMSRNGSYVGAFPANINDMSMEPVTNVNEDGTDDLETSPDLLLYDENNNSYHAATWPIQSWNRAHSSVLAQPRGFDFEGVQGVLESGLNSYKYFGKKQAFDTTNIPVETIEVIPYDSLSVPSAFPRFSCSLAESTQMWYHLTGAKTGQPLLFSELADMGITTTLDLSLYGDWAVTNADYDTIFLEGRTDVVCRKIEIRYFKLEINLHSAEQ